MLRRQIIVAAALLTCGTVSARAQVPEPPTEFMVTEARGSRVSLHWVPPASGPAPTAYRLAGGASLGAEIGGIVLPATPAVELDLPPGFWYLRVHTIAGGQLSVASNEWTVRVGSAAAPSSPGDLIGLVSGSALTLAWRNRFQGGQVESNRLDVSGAVTASLPLPRSTTFSFAAVPAGTFTFRIRSENSAGVSPASNAVTLAFPGPCSGTPHAVEAFTAYNVGRTLSLRWRKPSNGPAPTNYRLAVSGAFTGTFPLPLPDITAGVGPGTYTFTVTPTSPCGDGPTTAPQTVVVP